MNTDLGYIPLFLLCIGLFGLVIRLKRKDKQLQEAFQSLVGASLMKDEFLAVMSHELRTPLTAVIGYSELMLEGIGGATTVEQQDMLQRIDIASKHLMTLIQQVLDLSRAQHGKLIPNYARVDVRTLTSHTAMIASAMASRKGLQFFVNVPADQVLCDVDPGKYRQILLNLIGNAVKFTDEGSITVQLRPTNNCVVLSVHDTGIGIPADLQDRIFEPFFRVDGGLTRAKDGAGLGLAIVRTLVDVMNGSIKVRSVAGEGSEFEIRIPRYCASDEEMSPAPEPVSEHKLELIVPMRGDGGQQEAGPARANITQLCTDAGSTDAYPMLSTNIGYQPNLTSQGP
jgi:signal transduction histidine kinase